MCTFTYTLFSSSCSDETRDGLQDRNRECPLVREWFPVQTLLGQWLVWFSTGTRLAGWCGKQRHIALMQLPVPSGTEGEQQGPVVPLHCPYGLCTHVQQLLLVFACILRFAGEKLLLHLNMQCKIHDVHQHQCFTIIWSLEAIGAEPQTRVNFWKQS